MAKATEKSVERTQLQAANAEPANGNASSPNGVPTREQIELRAYEIYLQRGCVDGLDLQDWVQAESALTAEAENDTTRAKAARA